MAAALAASRFELGRDMLAGGEIGVSEVLVVGGGEERKKSSSKLTCSFRVASASFTFLFRGSKADFMLE